MAELARVKQILEQDKDHIKLATLAPEKCTKQLDPYLTCSLCHGVLTPAMVECGECDQLNCRACIEEWKREEDGCPNCWASDVLGNPNRFVASMLNDFEFTCSKCRQTLRYTEYVKHDMQCNVTVRCPLPQCGAVGNEA